LSQRLFIAAGKTKLLGRRLLKEKEEVMLDERKLAKDRNPSVSGYSAVSWECVPLSRRGHDIKRFYGEGTCGDVSRGAG
jgi:hypothetical protein